MPSGNRRATREEEPPLSKAYDLIARAYFVVATGALIALAMVLLVWALWDVAVAVGTPSLLGVLMDSIGLLIIGFAVVETGKFIAEEEIFRQREMRSASESRRSLTKFVTIIVIAASLEALVMVFKSSHGDISNALYPAALFVAAMFGLVCLGAYQWLSSRIDGAD